MKLRKEKDLTLKLLFNELLFSELWKNKEHFSYRFLKISTESQIVWIHWTHSYFIRNTTKSKVCFIDLHSVCCALFSVSKNIYSNPHTLGFGITPLKQDKKNIFPILDWKRWIYLIENKMLPTLSRVLILPPFRRFTSNLSILVFLWRVYKRYVSEENKWWMTSEDDFAFRGSRSSGDGLHTWQLYSSRSKLTVISGCSRRRREADRQLQLSVHTQTQRSSISPELKTDRGTLSFPRAHTLLTCTHFPRLNCSQI